MCSPRWNGVLFFSKLKSAQNFNEQEKHQTHSGAKRCANRSGVLYLLWNKRIPFFIDMLVIVFYRGPVLINQKVAAISIGIDKEIENALLTKSGIYSPRHPYSCINVRMCVYVCVRVRAQRQLVFYSTLYVIRTFHLSILRPRNAWLQ